MKPSRAEFRSSSSAWSGRVIFAQDLEPVLTSHICNWDHTWVRVPNPKHRPGE